MYGSIHRTVVSESEMSGHLRQVFNYMTGGIALSGVVAWLTAASPAMMAIATQSSTQWVFFGIWMAFAFFMHKIIFNLSASAGLGVFVAFSALTGFALAPIVLIYTGASIITAFVVASAMFAGASLYGYTTKKSMAGMAGIMSMVGIGLLVAIVANIFIGSSQMSFFISLAVVPFVAFATAFEMNAMKENYATYAGDETMRSKMAILNAAGFYMNFVVMFLHLLRLLGVARGEE